MLKQKEYDWKDSNLALIGSDLDKDARLDSAETERAWDGCGESEGLRVWRIEKFKVKAWPESKYGQFHEGDSYIVYHSYKQSQKENSKLLFDIFFWIGSESTQDEYGTAAYKTVELDAKLRDAAVQHREVQHHETAAFKELFGGEIEYLPGGVETGFRTHVPETPGPELFRVKGVRENIEFKAVKLRKDKLNSGDVFVLDTWTKVFQWNGKNANPSEKLKAGAYIDSVVLARGKDTKKEVVEEGSEGEEFWSFVPEKFSTACVTWKTYEVQKEAKESDEDVKAFKKQLFRLQEQGGGLTFKKVKSAEEKHKNKVAKAYLDSGDVFILDDGFIVWVWIGKNASAKERGGGMNYAMKYIKNKKRPVYMPIRQIREEKEPLVFLEHFHDGEKDSSCTIS